MRPYKYDTFIRALKDDELYTKAMVKDLGFQNSLHLQFTGVQEPIAPKALKRMVKNARGALGNFVHKNLDKPDSYIAVRIPFLAFHPVWWGRTWKEGLAFSLKNQRRRADNCGPNGASQKPPYPSSPEGSTDTEPKSIEEA